MKVPDKAQRRIKRALWEVADDVNWPTLPDPQKSALYEEWIRDAQVGGALSRYLDTPEVFAYTSRTRS